jgi:hypothetical protein
MHDAADDPSIIHPVRTRPVPGQERLDPRPLLVAEPKFAGHNPPPLRVNHDFQRAINRLIGFSP